MGRKKAVGTVRLNVRMSEALLADIQEWADRHRRSLNEEIVQMLMRPKGRALRKALLDMEPEYGDTRTDEEIAREIEWLQGSDMSWAYPSLFSENGVSSAERAGR